MAAKREIKKLKEDRNYAVLSGGSSVHPGPLADTDDMSMGGSGHFPSGGLHDSDSSTRSPTKKLGFINKFFKTKAKNSDDEASTSSAHDPPKRYENTESHSSQDSDGPKYEAKGVINRKKKRTLALYDKKAGNQKKHPGWAKIRPTPDRPHDKETSFLTFGDQDIASSNDSLIDPNSKSVVTLTEGTIDILEEFDPLWTGGANRNETLDGASLEEIMKLPVKPPRNKINTEKMPAMDKNTTIKLPEIKVATLEAIQENDLPEEELPLNKSVLKDGNSNDLLVKAKVSYEGLDGVFTKLVVYDNSNDVKEGGIRMVDTAFGSVPHDLASASYAELQPVFVQPLVQPMMDNIFGVTIEELNEKDKAPEACVDQLIEPLEDVPPEFQDLIDLPSGFGEQEVAVYEPTEEEEDANRQMIANFFAEKARILDDDDIENFSNQIEISKIEIYEEDVKRYHESLKYIRGPVSHDIIFTTVETALNFIEKLVKERDQRRKVGFFPELFERCLKSKAKKEEEEKKKKEQEEKKKKGPSKPKMWLVFNRMSKEKVIICTPADFYDSD